MGERVDPGTARHERAYTYLVVVLCVRRLQELHRLAFKKDLADVSKGRLRQFVRERWW